MIQKKEESSKKRINTSRKGARNQRLTELFLQHQFNAIVHTVTRPSYRGQSHDFFGYFDHIAIKPLRMLFIQTKSNRLDRKDFVEACRFTADNISFPAMVYFFVWIDGSNIKKKKRSLKIYEYIVENFINEEDFMRQPYIIHYWKSIDIEDIINPLSFLMSSIKDYKATTYEMGSGEKDARFN